LCRARGDEACRFIMAPPARLDGRVAAHRAKHAQCGGRTASVRGRSASVR